MGERRSKLVPVADAAAMVQSGSTLAIGGLSYYNAPSALIRHLVKQGVRELTLVTSVVCGLQADLLIGSGCVKKIISPYVAFEDLGLARNFRRAVESGELEVEEVGEAYLAFALRAASCGAPFHPLAPGIEASDLPRYNPRYKTVCDPYSGREVVCVPALAPDVALLHAQQCDPYGNSRYLGSTFMDSLLARASRRVIVSCDQVIPVEETRREPRLTSIPSFKVEAVVHLPYGSHPAGSQGLYGPDRAHLKAYLNASKGPQEFATYLQGWVTGCEGPSSYLDRVGAGQLGGLALAPPSAAVDADRALADPCSRGELMTVVMSRCLRDGYLTAAGSGSWEVAAACRLAQLTHAPNLSWLIGGTGAINPTLEHLPESVNDGQSLVGAEGLIDLEEVFTYEMKGDFDIFFASGLQVDRFGNLNLVAVGDPRRPKLRGPGTVGLEFIPRIKEVVIFIRSHFPSSFVERVDFVSGVGFLDGPGGRERYGLNPDQGPKLVVTNLAVMDFDPHSRGMRLQSVHPGVTVEEVIAKTGFELLLPQGPGQGAKGSPQVPQTPLPTPQELQLLRQQIDRGGLLRRLIS